MIIEFNTKYNWYTASSKGTPVKTVGRTPLEALSKLLAIIFH